MKLMGINNVNKYADETVLIAPLELGLQKIVKAVSECSKRAELKINGFKTKVIVIFKQNNAGGAII